MTYDTPPLVEDLSLRLYAYLERYGYLRNNDSDTKGHLLHVFTNHVFSAYQGGVRDTQEPKE